MTVPTSAVLFVAADAPDLIAAGILLLQAQGG
jgi:hypothetical protein